MATDPFAAHPLAALPLAALPLAATAPTVACHGSSIAAAGRLGNGPASGDNAAAQEAACLRLPQPTVSALPDERPRPEWRSVVAAG